MKILIVTETIAGLGHEKAAKSLAKAIKQSDSAHDIKIVSLLEIYNKAIEKTLRIIYIQMIKKAPFVWHWMYKNESSFAVVFKEIIASIMLNKLSTYIKNEKPNLIIATHASGLGTLVKLKNKYNYSLAAVFTDYQLNNFWIYNNIDYYFVPHEDFRIRLIENRIDPSRIHVTGIPIDPIFSEGKTKIKNQKETQEKFKLLIMGGGLGLGGIRDVFLALNELKELPISITVVTGTNQKLYNKLTKLQTKVNSEIEILRFVDDIYSLMINSDLLISKPGGITISEALSTQIPILVYKPIPGQEEHNVRFLIKNKSAIRIREIGEISYWVRYLYNHPKLCEKLKEREKKISRPASSLHISQVLLRNKK